LFGALWTAAGATPPAAPVSASPSTASSAQPAADEGFLEFLGSDDVGDAAWWEFLKKAPPPRGSDPPPAASPQDAKK
jgi:hypothetical protein